MCKHGGGGAEAGNSFREKLSCVTRENICNLLTVPRHQEGRKTFQEFRTAASPNQVCVCKLAVDFFKSNTTSPALKQTRAFSTPSKSSTSATGPYPPHVARNAIRPYKAACVHLAALFTKSHVWKSAYTRGACGHTSRKACLNRKKVALQLWCPHHRENAGLKELPRTHKGMLANIAAFTLPRPFLPCPPTLTRLLTSFSNSPQEKTWHRLA